MIVSFRFGDRWDIRRFIDPDNPDVKDVAQRFAHLPKEQRVIELWRFVTEDIRYPFTLAGVADDLHRLHAFPLKNYPIVGQLFRISRDQVDFFQLPSETLAWGIGDCEDTSILLTSLLRSGNLCSPEEVFAALGFVGENGHVWVEYKGRMMETTLDGLPPSPRMVYNSDNRTARFNDVYAEGTLTRTDPRALLEVERLFDWKTKLRR